MVARQHGPRAAPDPALRRMGVVGGVGGVHEEPRSGRVCLGLRHQRQQRVMQEGPLRVGVGLGRHHLRPLPDEADPAQEARHRVRRVGQAEADRDETAHCLGGEGDPSREFGRQRRHLRLAQHRHVPDIGQALHPGPAAQRLEPAVRAHRLGVDEQRLRHPLGRPAAAEQQQRVHPPAHRAVPLPAQRRRVPGTVLSGQYGARHHQSESDQTNPRQADFEGDGVYYSRIWSRRVRWCQWARRARC